MRESCVQSCASGTRTASVGIGTWIYMQNQVGDPVGNSPFRLRLRKKYVLVTYTVKHGGCWTASIENAHEDYHERQIADGQTELESSHLRPFLGLGFLIFRCLKKNSLLPSGFFGSHIHSFTLNVPRRCRSG